MPLWSNEDWRARIGSCWCALGRTFNTRFTRCRGKSQRDLSTHQAATMVIMMILFIAANMGLYVTRERHKNLICVLETITELYLLRFGLSLFVPVTLKFVVQMVGGQLSRKLKISLKQFFIDLNDGLWFIGSIIRTFIVSPVLYVVNFTTGNIFNVLGKISNHLTKLVGDRLSDGILMRSLVVVIVVTIQLLVSVMVARAIIFLLLLISGDVERNPGPENIDYSVTKELVVELETTAVQASLLLRCGDVESNPGPLTREGGVNQKRSIDKVVKSGQINDPDRMFNDLSFVIYDKYMEIGVDLGLGYDYLHNQLETSGVSVTETGNKKAMKMLKLWQQFIDKDHFTYSVLATTLEKYGFHDAAYKYCYTDASFETLLGQVPLSPRDLQYVNRQKFVDSYLAQEHSTDAWPPLKIVEFVKLSLVKQKKDVYHMNLRTIEKDIDAVYGGKSNITYEDVFKTVDNMSLVLFEGRPGSGKTTLLVRISCDWARGAILNSKLVVLVRLRHLNKTEDTCLHDILSVACPGFFTFGDRQCLSSYIEERLGKNVVFLLDGFDEYTPGASNDNYISKLILKKVCPRSIVILSSRPAATQRFRLNASIYIEVVGFMKEQVSQYINCYFEDDKEKSLFLLKHLEKHQNLMNLCYLPLHCAMLVFFYKDDDILPETETEFYRDFTLSLLIRGICKHTDNTPYYIESFDCLPDAEKDIFHKICKLAFKATVDSRQVFKEREVKEICFSDNSKERVGLVVIDRYFAKCGIDETYTFLHLTLQEYLAALFVSRLSESEQVIAMATLFSRQHLFVTSRFLFGILDYSKENTKKLFEQMLGATKDHQLHHIQCACESHSASPCTDVVKFHDKNLSFQSINNSSDIFYITHVLKTSEFDAIELSFSECNFDINDAVSLLQGVGDRQLSLTMKQGEAAQSMVNALSHVTVSGLVVLDYCDCHVTSVAEVSGEGLQHMTKAHHTTDQTLEITLDNCVFNKEAAIGLLQAVGDRRLSLSITDMNRSIDAAQPLVDALCLVTLPGLIELNVSCVVHLGVGCPTMRPNNLKHSTNLQKLKLNGLDISNSGLEKALKHWPNLVELVLCRCHCRVTSVAEVLEEGLQHKAHHTTDQTLEITFKDCVFNKEAAVGLLQAVGDRRLSLTLSHENRDIDAQPLVDALCFVTLPGLIELNVRYADDDGDEYLTMRPNNLKHSTYLQKFDLHGLDISNSGLEKALKHWPNLMELKLDNCHCHVTSVAEVLGEGLQHMTKAHHTTDQTLEITLQDCDFNKEAAVGLLQAVGDRRLSLTIRNKFKSIDAAQSLVDALCLVTLPGLIELNVSCVVRVGAGYLTMRPNNLKHSTNLQKLKLLGLDVSNSGLEKALKHWPNLVELKLEDCHIDASTAVLLGESLQHTSKLQTLNQTLEITLQDCDFNKEAAVGLLQAVGDRRLSLTITYYKYKYMDIDAAQPLVDALCLVTLPGLIELNVSCVVHLGVGAGYQTMRPNNLKHSTNLQKLKLFGLDISNSGPEKALKHLPNLMELNLAGCKIDASTSVVLGESLQHTSKLQTLNLSNNSICDDRLHALSLSIKNFCKELKELRLCETQLTDRSITCLTEWIKVLNNLEKLNLTWNHFSEGGVKQIKEAVSERNTREGVAKLKLDISSQVPY